jgi:hypothetical protein
MSAAKSMYVKKDSIIRKFNPKLSGDLTTKSFDAMLYMCGATDGKNEVVDEYRGP